MLRTALLCFAVLLTLGGSVGLLAGHACWPPTLWGLMLLACVLFERWRYRNPSAHDGGNWQPTGEQFIDPATGQPMEVEYDADTGERRYVPHAHH